MTSNTILKEACKASAGMVKAGNYGWGLGIPGTGLPGDPTAPPVIHLNPEQYVKQQEQQREVDKAVAEALPKVTTDVLKKGVGLQMYTAQGVTRGAINSALNWGDTANAVANYTGTFSLLDKVFGLPPGTSELVAFMQIQDIRNGMDAEGSPLNLQLSAHMIGNDYAAAVERNQGYIDLLHTIAAQAIISRVAPKGTPTGPLKIPKPTTRTQEVFKHLGNGAKAVAPWADDLGSSWYNLNMYNRLMASDKNVAQDPWPASPISNEPGFVLPPEDAELLGYPTGDPQTTTDAPAESNTQSIQQSGKHNQPANTSVDTPATGPSLWDNLKDAAPSYLGLGAAGAGAGYIIAPNKYKLTGTVTGGILGLLANYARRKYVYGDSVKA